MIDLLKQALNFSHAAREWLPHSRSGRPVHPSVLGRWADRGIVVNGQRVYLDTWRVGGQRMTTQDAVEKFLAALNSGSQTSNQEDKTASDRRSREAGQALERLGA